MRLICSYMFPLVVFLRSWNFHQSFPGIWLSSSLSQLHDHRNDFAPVAVQGAVLVHHPVSELHSPFLQHLVLLCSVTVVVLCHLLRGHHSCVPHPCMVSANVLSLCHCFSLFSPDSVTFHWCHPCQELFSNTAVTLLKIPSQMLCQLLIIGTPSDLLIAVFFNFLQN